MARTSTCLRLALPAVTLMAFALPAAQVTVANAAPAAASQASYAHQGEAYGSRVNVGRKVRSGPSAPVYLGCTTTSGLSRTNFTAGVNLASVLVSGTVTSTADTSTSPVKSRTSSTVQTANLLSGLISATAVRSVSATSHDGTGFHLNPAGTTFTHLVIAGRTFSATVAPNTRINLAGFGHIIVNEQLRNSGPTSASLTVNALHLGSSTRPTASAWPSAPTPSSRTPPAA